MKVIEAKARISAEDATGAVFDKIAKKIDNLAKSGKAAKTIDDVSKSMARVQTQMSAIDKFTNSRSAFDFAQKRLRAAQAAAEAHKAAVATMASPNRVAVEAEHRRLSRAIDLATKAYDQQKDSVFANRSALMKAGVPIKDAVAHQGRLREAVEQTNLAIDRQTKVQERSHARRQAIGTTVAAGAAMAGAYVLGHGGKKLIESGAHFQHETTALQNVGRTPDEMKQINEASRRVSKAVPTATFTENLKVLNETTGAFGSLEHAIENLEFMQKANSVVHSAAGGKVHDGAGEMGNKLARFFEMRGTAGDHHVFQKEAEQLVRAMVFTGGNFNPSEALNFAQQAKGALTNYNMDFLGGVAPSLVTEMGGDRAGTGANAWRGVLMGKVRDAKQTKRWEELGLVDPKMVDRNAKGAPMSWSAGAVKDTDMALKNPLEWTEKTLIPALQKKGVNVDDPLALSKELGTMFRNQNANQFAEQITQQRARTRLHKDRDLMDKVKPVDQMYAANMATDPTQAIKAVTASLESLASAASSPAMVTAAGMLSSLAGGLQTLAQAANENPKLAMTGAATGAAAITGGSAYMGWKMLNGFGLASSATALDGAAVALTNAAGVLSGSKAAEVAGAGAAGAGARRAGMGVLGMAGTAGLLLGGTAAAYYAMRSAPAMGGNTPGSRTRAGYIGGAPAPAGFDYEGLAPKVAASRAGRASSVWDGPKGTTESYLRNYDGGKETGAYGGGKDVSVTGEATLNQKFDVNVKLNTEMLRAEIVGAVNEVVSKIQLRGGGFGGNGPGSTGRSSPDAAAPSTGFSSGGHH